MELISTWDEVVAEYGPERLIRYKYSELPADVRQKFSVVRWEWALSDLIHNPSGQTDEHLLFTQILEELTIRAKEDNKFANFQLCSRILLYMRHFSYPAGENDSHEVVDHVIKSIRSSVMEHALTCEFDDRELLIASRCHISQVGKDVESFILAELSKRGLVDEDFHILVGAGGRDDYRTNLCWLSKDDERVAQADALRKARFDSLRLADDGNPSFSKID